MNQHAMMQTISEQPALIRRLYENRKEITKDFVAFFQTHDIKKIYLSGHGAASVSYTNLDVYKRQIYRRASRWATMSWYCLSALPR